MATNPKCDFCSSPEIRWSYPAVDFAIPQYGIGSNGGWAACDVCHTLIDAEQWEALARRAAQTHPLSALLSEEELMQTMAIIHVGFRAARTGPAAAVNDMIAQVKAFIMGGPLDRVKQAILDGQACRESRRIPPGAEDACTCFCCTLRRYIGPAMEEKVMR